MKILHIADLHCCREHMKEALASLQCATEAIKKSPVDLAAIAGDTWDASVLNTEASGFMDAVNAIRQIADRAPVAMIYGTPSHDTDGSLEVFRTINARYPITILEAGQAYFLENGRIIADDGAAHKAATALLFGIPEPRKKYLLANATAGKDDTEQAIRDAMSRLCFALGAKRREHPDLPCVVLYHGDVAGSVMQNDRSVERGTGIAITVDDLKAIGADYYALGHIHEPQQVGKSVGITAYYAGSIYPKNFGETHKAGCNVVTIQKMHLSDLADIGKSADCECQATIVHRIDFPHPQNIHLVQRYDGKPVSSPSEVNGKRVWAEITCTKAQRPNIDDAKILQDLMKCGAVEGSRVTVTEDATETVRAGEITQAASPSAKAKVWASNSSITLTDSVLQKIAQLETATATDNSRARGAWELVSVKLRGATGILKGIHKDEVTLDFSRYDTGLIALTGKNGKGKTTLIENCHPYPQMLTRGGKLADHFSLRDSFREVVYHDRDSGRYVKALIQVDGATKSGGAKYFAYTSVDGVHWEAVPGVDGNLKPYTAWVDATFGGIDLFLRTAFTTQRATKNLPDLTDATAGEKKALFVELAGIDYLQVLSDAANDRAKGADLLAHDASIRAEVLTQTVAKKDTLTAELASKGKELERLQSELDKTVANGKTADAEVKAAQIAAEAERTRAKDEAEARKRQEAIRIDISDLTESKINTQHIADCEEMNEKCIAEYDRLQGIIDKEKAKQNVVAVSNAERLATYMKNKEAYDATIKAAQSELDRLQSARNTKAADNDVNERYIETDKRNMGLRPRVLQSSTENSTKLDVVAQVVEQGEIIDTCPTCGQKLPVDKIAELNAKRDEVLADIKKLQDKIADNNADIAKLDEAIAGRKQAIAEMGFDAPAKPKQQVFIDTMMQEAQRQQNALNIKAAREGLETAKTAAVRIEGIDAQLATKSSELNEVQKRIDTLQAKRNDKAESALQDAQSRYTALKEAYTQCKAAIAAAQATIDSTNASLDDIATSEAELKDVKAAIAKQQAEGADWALITRAFGRDGVQALELDALAPGISQTANNLLQAAYGDRFTIGIETTRIGGKGKSTRQIEDFKIMVTDSEDGEPTALENKSGGEAVWIKRAIYDAFAVIRRRNTAFAFLTCFQDEADGALDADAKTAYCRMLEASHQAAGMRHTVIITHSNEVKAMIEQRVDMEAL